MAKTFCKNCDLFVERDHRCFLKPLPRAENVSEELMHILSSVDSNSASESLGKLSKFIFFDAETRIGMDDRHICYLLVAQTATGDFMVFSSVKEFCDNIFTVKYRGYRIFGFNSRSFDTFLLVEYLATTLLVIEPLIVDRKFVELRLPQLDISVCDLLSFVSARLCDLPKILSLDESASKTFFPYAALNYGNYEANKNYIGPIFPKSMFEFEAMGEERREHFNRWYDEKKNAVYDLKEESIAYCKADVNLLRKAANKFNYLFMKLTNGEFSPLETCVTMPQAVLRYYRFAHLPEDTIAIMPYGGYLHGKRNSAEAIRWISWISRTEGINIRHSRNCSDGVGGEKTFAKYSLDGFYEDGSGKMIGYEYYGTYCI